MADQDPGAIFGFDDANLGAPTAYVDDVNTPSIKTDTSDPNNNRRNPSVENTFLYDAPNWSYQDTPGYDFNFAASSGAVSTTLFQTASWELPADQQQQQQQQQHPSRQRYQGHQDTSSIGNGYAQPAQTQETFDLTSPITFNPSIALRQGPHPSRNAQVGDHRGILSAAQQEKLRNIAMPQHLQYQSPRSEPSPGSATSDAKAVASASAALSSPDGQDPSHKSLIRKRKSSADIEEEEEDEDGQPIKKTAHNMIEKRYRTNLNDKIAALRDSVPSLRIMSKSARGEDTTEDREELHGLTPAHKLNKATVLSKATEYIRHLEKRNNRLLDENGAMQARIAAFEQLFMAGAMTGGMSPLQQPPTPMQYPQDQYISTPMGTPPDAQAQGMIQVPEDMKRILAAQISNQPYPVPQQQFRGNPAVLRQQQIQQHQQQIQQTGRWSNAGPYLGKLMVGSLAGLMIIEAVRTDEQSNETPEGRGLFALPMQLLNSFGPDSHVHIAGHVIATARVISHLKVLLVLGIFLWVFVPMLFTPSQKPKKGEQQLNGTLQSAPSPASPIHVRRQAWLTAIQSVWIPQHNIFMEAAALILKTMKLSLRNTIGINGYQMLTGLTEEQEAARVKAWSIALDAQLAGGDVEINKSRLTLTLLASGTLPDTPLRLMLKALHIRVLLWDLGAKGLHNSIAAKLARSRWNEARQLNRMLAQLRRTSGQPSDDDLPDHLASLLKQECDDVLNNSVIRRAYNLAWNLPTTENVNDHTDGMDSVVDDQAVRSPMDAVAAWWSSQQVQHALSASLAAGEDDEGVQETVANYIDKALQSAPIASGAQARAMVAKAVLVNNKRGASIADAVQTIQPSRAKKQASQDVILSLLDSNSPVAVTPDIETALRCAMAIAHLNRTTPVTPANEGVRLVEKIVRPNVTARMSLLGGTALFKLMNEMHAHPCATETFSASLERLAGTLRIWVGGIPGEKCGLDQDVRHQMVNRCLGITKSIVGLETDTGYGSMSDCDEESGC